MRGTVYASCLNDDGTVSLYFLINGVIPVEIDSFAGTDLYDPDIEYLMWGNDFDSNKKTKAQLEAEEKRKKAEEEKSNKPEDIYGISTIDSDGNKTVYIPKG